MKSPEGRKFTHRSFRLVGFFSKERTLLLQSFHQLKSKKVANSKNQFDYYDVKCYISQVFNFKMVNDIQNKYYCFNKLLKETLSAKMNTRHPNINQSKFRTKIFWKYLGHIGSR